MADIPPPRIGFTRRELKAFKIHALLMAALAAGFGTLVRPGTTQVLGALLAVALVPVPPLVVYLLRRRRGR